MSWLGSCAQDIGDIVIGSVLGDSSQRAIQVRIAGFLAGVPENVAVHTVNRCALLPVTPLRPCRNHVSFLTVKTLEMLLMGTLKGSR